MSFKLLNELLSLREADEDMTAGVVKIASDLKSGYDSAKNNQNLKKEFNDFISTFFTKYPNGSDTFEDQILAKHNDRDDLLNLFKSLKGMAEDLEKQRVAFNAGLVKAKLVPKSKIDEINAQVRKYFADNTTEPPPQLVTFVRTEASFFKRLFAVTGQANEFELDDTTFKQLLIDKIKRTDAHRIGDAAQAMNLLLTHIIREFTAMAKTTAEKGRKATS